MLGADEGVLGKGGSGKREKDGVSAGFRVYGDIVLPCAESGIYGGIYGFALFDPLEAFFPQKYIFYFCKGGVTGGGAQFMVLDSFFGLFFACGPECI